MPLIDHDALLAIRQNRWVLDCVRMSLRRQSGGPDRFVGGGAIRQTPHGGLEFVLYDTTAEVSLPEMMPQVGTGEWLTAAAFWTLSATDLYGYVWEAEWVDAASSTTYAQPGAIVQGSFDHVTVKTEKRRTKESGFLGFAPTTSRVPANQLTETVQTIDGREAKSFETNLWKVDCGAAGSLLVTQLDDGINAHLLHDGEELPPEIGVRLEEGLTLVLATPVNWLVEQTSSGDLKTVTVNSRSRVTGEPRLGPPLVTRGIEARFDCGVLLARYLAHALARPLAENERHPLAVSIAKVLRASGSTLEDESLALATEVESIVRSHFFDRGKSPCDFVKAIGDALKHLAQWAGPNDVRRRIEGALNGMTGQNPRTALRTLATEGVISERHVDAWEAIRHQATHGLRSSKTARETVAKNDVVYQLLLLLVFHVLGYTGRFTDYTTKGWPPIMPKQCVANSGNGGTPTQNVVS